MSTDVISEGRAAQFETAGGTKYTIWITTDSNNTQACNIRVEPQERCAKLLSFKSLTCRENEVANLVAEGWTNAEIADELCISMSTVKCHIQNIYEKLGISNRATLSHYYQKAIA